MSLFKQPFLKNEGMYQAASVQVLQFATSLDGLHERSAVADLELGIVGGLPCIC